MGKSAAANWAGRWARAHRYQSTLEIRANNMDNADKAHEDLKNAHEGAVYSAFPSGMGIDLRPGGETTLGSVRSDHTPSNSQPFPKYHEF